jgi:membrane-bound ClpP family serine protease
MELGNLNIATKKDLMDLIKVQKDIIIDAYDEELLSKNEEFRIRNKYLKNFVKTNNINIYIPIIRNSWVKKILSKIGFYVLLFIFLFYGMWSSYFFFSSINSSRESNFLIDFIREIMLYLTIAFVAIFIWFYFYSRRSIRKSQDGTEKNKKEEKNSPIINYLIFLNKIEEMVKFLPEKEVNKKIENTNVYL